MKKENYNCDKSVRCGKTTDDVKTLTKLCNDEAAKLALSIEIPDQIGVEVSFWTKDRPELICIGKYSKDVNGSIIYELDFSESTL